MKLPRKSAGGICPSCAGVALLGHAAGHGHTDTRLRWPNDLLVGRSKLAGILVERPSDHMAVIGIGVNVFNDVAGIAGMVQDPPARLSDLLPDCPSVHGVMAALASHLDRVFTAFSRGGISAPAGFRP